MTRATKLILAALYIFTATLITYQVFARGLANGSGTPAADPIASRASTIKLVDGTADRPFVFRRLVPETINQIYAAIPHETRNRIHRQMAADTTRNAFPGAIYHQANLMHSIAFLVWVAALTGFAFTMRKAFKLTHPANAPLQSVGPVLCLLGVAAFGYVNFYVYDAATPLVFALALTLAMSGRTALFWLLLIPAAYHKETAVVLPIIFACFSLNRLGPKKTLIIAAAQLALVIGILATLRFAYQANPGESLEIHLASNWHALTHPKPITLLLVALMIATAIAIRRFIKQGISPEHPLYLEGEGAGGEGANSIRKSPHSPNTQGLKRTAAILLPTAFTLYLITGMFLETRSLLELWPLLSLVLIPPLFINDQPLPNPKSEIQNPKS